MKGLFTKSFFKFTAGFLGIVAFAMVSALAISAYSVDGGASGVEVDTERAQ